MAISKAILRLRQILDIEEESCRREMEAAQRDHSMLLLALADAGTQQRAGRCLAVQGMAHGVLPDRLAGIEIAQSGERRAAALRERIEESLRLVEKQRAAYLSKRVERRQAEELVNQAHQQEAQEAERHAQQSLDDWYSARSSVETVKQLAGKMPSADPHSQKSPELIRVD